MWSWTVETIDTPGRNFEKEGRLVEPRAFQDAINRRLRFAVFKHGLPVRTTEEFCCCLKPLAHPWALIPESTGVQVGQKVAKGQVLATLGLLAVTGTFFYFMVKAMARIQMPTRE